MQRNTTLTRLALALLIGASTGPWFSLTQPTVLDALLCALAMAVPPLLAVTLMKTTQPGAPLRTGLFVALLVVLLPLGDVLLNAIQGHPRLDVLFIVGLAIVLCPLIAAFSVGTRGARLRGTAALALGCGAMAWLGIGVHNLLVPLLLGQFSSTGPSSGFGDLVFVALLVFYLVGFVLALLLGIVGALLRLWLARPVQ